MSVDGKSVIITGAGQGLGRAAAKVFARRGALLTITGRTPATLESAAEEIRAEGGRVEVVPGDAGDRADVARAVDAAVAAYGGIDVLVNNAQALEFGIPLLEVTDENIEIPFRSGTLGTLYFMQACHPHLKARGGGSIVNFGSAAGLDGMAGFGPYAIAKEAIRGLSRTAAREWGPDNIRVNVICPAGLTDRLREKAYADPEVYAAKAATIPLRRLGDPERDIAGAILALVSDDFAYLTGHTFSLDGGQRFLT